MSATRQPRAIAILLTTLSCGWLLSRLELLPGIEWAAIVAIGLLGMLTLALGSLDRQTFLTGFFLLIASMVAILRETDHLSSDLMMPGLLTSLGLLMLVSQVIPNPLPRWPAAIEDAGHE